MYIVYFVQKCIKEPDKNISYAKILNIKSRFSCII